MRIFYVCQRVPYPPDRGDKIITYNEIRHLARRHEVHVFCLADGEEDLANVAGLADCAAGVTAIRVAPWQSRLRALRALGGDTPLSVAMLCEPRLAAAVRRATEVLRPDLFFVFSSNVAQYAEAYADLPRLMHFVDLDSMKWCAYAERSVPPLAWLYALEARRLLAYERRIAQAFRHAMVCTQTEAEDFRRLIPGVAVSVLPNGVDLDYFRTSGAPKQSGAMVFTGVMNYRPNVDAVCWFCETMLPLVRRAVPGATLTICGSRPARAVRQLARLPGVTVTGRVPDVRPYLDRAEVFVAPLRLARGIQNKLLEAMAMGLPVVSSTVAWRATQIPAGDGIVPADGAEAFAASVLRLLQDGTHRAAMAACARRAVEERYAWPDKLAALDRVIATALATGT